MIDRTNAAIERLEQLARLFEVAARHVRPDTRLLSEALAEAARVLDGLGPVMTRIPAGADADVVASAAQRAREQHVALTGAIAAETSRIECELARLATGSKATARYAAVGQKPAARRWLERSA